MASDIILRVALQATPKEKGVALVRFPLRENELMLTGVHNMLTGFF